MTQEQCESISKQFESVALPKSGIVQTTDKDLVRAPETIGGYGIKDLYTKQFASHIQSLIDHGTSQSVTGRSTHSRPRRGRVIRSRYGN